MKMLMEIDTVKSRMQDASRALQVLFYDHDTVFILVVGGRTQCKGDTLYYLPYIMNKGSKIGKCLSPSYRTEKIHLTKFYKVYRKYKVQFPFSSSPIK